MSKDRAEEEARAERQRLKSEYSSTYEGRVNEIEEQARKARAEVIELKE
jgi:hypothetical protein